MDDFMNDINSPEPQKQPAANEPAQKSVIAEEPPVSSKYRFKPITSFDDFEETPPAAEGSVVLEVVKAILGAVVGAIPGMLLWILIGKIGFVAVICGMILAVGVTAGYKFMTKDDFLPEIYGVVICVAVIAVSIYLAERIVWSWELSEQFTKYMASLRSEMYELGEAGGMERSEVDEILNDSLKEEFGFYEGTFGECFSNFHKTLSTLGLAGRYFRNLLFCYGIAALGAFSIFKKMK